MFDWAEGRAGQPTARDIPVFYTAQRGNQDRRDRGLQAELWGPGMRALPEHEQIVDALAPQPGDPRYGAYLTWLYWYGNVMEPVIIFEAAQIRHDWLRTTFRGTAEVKARLRSALEKGPWLLGDTYSAADLLVHSPYAWFKEATPDDELIRDWVARCMARPSAMRTAASDAALRAG